MKPVVLCTAPLHFLPDVKVELERDFEMLYAFNEPREKVAALLPRAAGLVTNPGTAFRYDAALLSRAAALKFIVTPSTGRDHIDLEWCRERGVDVEALRGHEDVIADIHSSAEFSFALLLAMIRKLVPAAEGARQGRWREVEDEFRGIELHSKKVLLVGYGRIGRKMSRFLHAFGAEVAAVDPFQKELDPWVRRFDALEAGLPWADVVSLHLHLDPETKGLFGAAQFGMMRAGAYFLNSARGSLIDEKALVAVLESGRLAAAAVDVIEGEQGSVIADSPLVRLARARPDLLTVTPHIAGLSVDSQRKAARFAARCLREKLLSKETAR